MRAFARILSVLFNSRIFRFHLAARGRFSYNEDSAVCCGAWRRAAMKRLKRDKYEDESWLSNANVPLAKAFSRIIMIAGCSAALNMFIFYFLRKAMDPTFDDGSCLILSIVGPGFAQIRATSWKKSDRDTVGIIDVVSILVILTVRIAVDYDAPYLYIPLVIEIGICVWLYIRAVRKKKNPPPIKGK